MTPVKGAINQLGRNIQSEFDYVIPHSIFSLHGDFNDAIARSFAHLIDNKFNLELPWPYWYPEETFGKLRSELNRQSKGDNV